MSYALNATIALAPAAPGWTVTAPSPRSGDVVVCPVVAWASVVVDHNSDGQAETELQPTFVLDGAVWTKAELVEVRGGAVTILSPAVEWVSP
jgi:hypothetical protein